MAPTSIEVKAISCKGLKIFNFFRKIATYATISIVSLDPNKHHTVKKRYQQQNTPVDRDGGGNPEWKHQTKFDLSQIECDESLDSDHLYLQFDIMCEGRRIGDRRIGHIRVRIKELIEERTRGTVRFVCYQVTTSDGRPNEGVLDFSYKVIGAPVVESSTPSLYPSLEYLFPLPTIPKIYYPPASSPQTPSSPAGVVYYPPPPPPPPVHFPVPPPSYAPPAYSCSHFHYPTIDPCNDNTWQRDLPYTGEYVGYSYVRSG